MNLVAVVIFGSAAAILWGLLLRVMQEGKRAFFISHHPYSRRGYEDHARAARKLVIFTTVLFFLVPLVVEPMLRSGNIVMPMNALAVIHLCFVLGFSAILYLMYFFFPGIKNPIAHRKLSKWLLAFALLMTATGFLLLAFPSG